MKNLVGGLAAPEGGGTCRGWVESGGERYYTSSQVTQAQAIDYANSRALLIGDEGGWMGLTLTRTGWCCASCP